MATLTYDFRVVGLDSINRAFASIEQRVVKHNAAVTRATGVSRSSGGNPGQAMAREEARQTAAASRMTAKLTAQAERDQKRIESARLKEIERALKKEEGVRVRAAASAAKKAEQAAKLAAQAAKLAAQKEAKRKADWNREVTGAVGRGAGGVARGALAATGIAGGAWLGVATAGAVQQETAVRRLLINSRGAGQNQLMSEKELSGKIRGASVGSGISEGDITEGLGTIVARTGDLNKGVELMQTLATTAQATGASFSDLSSVASDLSTKFDIKSVEDMQQALAMLTFQGKAGAFEIKDMAQQFPALAARMSSLGMTGMGGLAKTGAMAQIIRDSTKSPEQAAFAMEAMPRQLLMKAADMKSGKAFGGKSKMNVFTDDTNTKLRDITQIIPEVLKASGGDMTKLQEIFGEQGMAGITPFLNTFQKNGGGAKGGAAVSKQIESAAAGGSWAEVQKDFGSAITTTSAQLEILNTKFKAAVETDFLPALQELLPAFTKLAPLAGDAVRALSSFVKFFVAHPFVGLSGMISAAILKEIAAAKLGDVFKNGVGGSFAAAAGTTFAVAGMALTVGMATIDVLDDASKRGNTAGAMGLAQGGAALANAQNEMRRTGGLSPETRAQLQGQVESYNNLMDHKNTGLGTMLWDTVSGGPRSISNELAAGEQIATANKLGTPADVAKMQELLDAATKAAAALNLVAAASPGGAAPGTINRGNSPTTPG